MKQISLAVMVKDFTGTSIDLWMQVRDEEGILKGYWEFPGGNIEKGETPKEAMIREVFEEVNLKLKEQDTQRFNNFFYEITPDNEISFFTFLVKDANPSKDKGSWFTVNLKDYEKSLPEKIPPANHRLIKNICLAFKNIQPKDYKLIWTQ